jgi:hypothetical protein
MASVAGRRVRCVLPSLDGACDARVTRVWMSLDGACGACHCELDGAKKYSFPCRWAVGFCLRRAHRATAPPLSGDGAAQQQPPGVLLFQHATTRLHAELQRSCSLGWRLRQPTGRQNTRLINHLSYIKCVPSVSGEPWEED